MLKTMFSHRSARYDLLIGLALLSALFLFIEFYPSSHIEMFLPKQVDYSSLNYKKQVVYEGYSLDRSFPYTEEKKTLVVCDLSNQIKLQVNPNRPDSSDKQICYMILSGSNAKEKIEFNQPIYLEAKDKSFKFSKNKTPLALIISEKNNSFYSNIKIQSEELEKEGYKIADLKGFKPAVEYYSEKKLIEPFKTLFNGLFNGVDLLSKDKLYQFQVDYNPLYFQRGDIFVFEKNKWQKVDSLANKENLPIFRVKQVDRSKLQLEGWSKDGKYFSSSFSPPKASSRRNKTTINIQEIRKRTSEKVSAKVSGKRMIIKVGDWLINKNGNWSILKTDFQKENFLKHKSDSEVFVFERIVENKGNRKIIALLYNPSRTSEQRLEFSFANTRKKTINNNRFNKRR